MSRNAVNFLLDAFLLICLVALMWSTAVLHVVFPPGPAAAGWRLWDGDHTFWMRVQLGTIAVLTLAVLVHLILHWAWVCGFVAARIARLTGRPIKTNEATRTLYGVATLAMVLTIFGALVAAAQFAVVRP